MMRFRSAKPSVLHIPNAWDQVKRFVFRAICTALAASTFAGCNAQTSAASGAQAAASGAAGFVREVRTRADDEMIPLAIGGVDHLANHVSVQNFWVNGYGGGMAGSGGGSVCCVSVPRKWKPGLRVSIRWEVLNWKDWESDEYTQSVDIEPYTDLGELNVHFLSNGRVRAVVSTKAPWSPTYAGPKDPIPQKKPWEVYGEQHRPTRCTDHSVTPPKPCED